MKIQRKQTLGDGFCGLNSVSEALFAALRTPHCEENDILRAELFSSPIIAQDIRNTIIYLQIHNVDGGRRLPDPSNITDLASLRQYFQSSFFDDASIQRNLVPKIFRVLMMRLLTAPKPDATQRGGASASAVMQYLIDPAISEENKEIALQSAMNELGQIEWVSIIRSIDLALGEDAELPTGEFFIDAFQKNQSAADRRDQSEKRLDLSEMGSKIKRLVNKISSKNAGDLLMRLAPEILSSSAQMTIQRPESRPPHLLDKPEGDFAKALLDPHNRVASGDPLVVLPEYLLSAFAQTGPLEGIAFNSYQAGFLTDYPVAEDGACMEFWRASLNQFDASFKDNTWKTKAHEFFDGCVARYWLDVGQLGNIIAIFFPAQSNDHRLVVTEERAGSTGALKTCPYAAVSVQNLGGSHFDLMVRVDPSTLVDAGDPRTAQIQAFQAELRKNCKDSPIQEIVEAQTHSAVSIDITSVQKQTSAKKDPKLVKQVTKKATVSPVSKTKENSTVESSSEVPTALVPTAPESVEQEEVSLLEIFAVLAVAVLLILLAALAIYWLCAAAGSYMSTTVAAEATTGVGSFSNSVGNACYSFGTTLYNGSVGCLETASQFVSGIHVMMPTLPTVSISSSTLVAGSSGTAIAAVAALNIDTPSAKNLKI